MDNISYCNFVGVLQKHYDNVLFMKITYYLGIVFSRGMPIEMLVVSFLF
jgi:hypothetical protein